MQKLAGSGVANTDGDIWYVVKYSKNKETWFIINIPRTLNQNGFRELFEIMIPFSYKK